MATTTSQPRTTWRQRQLAKRLGLRLPYPCTRIRASYLLGTTLDALRAADRG